jgi:hypothetical protein
MSDDLPSPTPEKSGDEKSADKTTGDERNGKPDEKFKLTQLEWGGFFGDIFVILWVWSDLIACHDFDRLVFLFAALVVAHGVLCIFISKIFNSWRFALILWILLCVPAAWIAYKNSRPEQKPYPHFNFGIANPKTLENEVDLTNDFLVFSSWGTSVPPAPIGYLIMPVKSESNITLNFSIANEGPTYFAEGVEVTVSIPKDFECEAEPPWGSGSSIDTNQQSLKIENISLFKESPAVLPPIIFQRIPLASEVIVSNSDNLTIWARGKDAPAQGIQFRLWFVTNSPTTKPFVVKANRENGTDIIPLIPQNIK